MEYTKQNPSGGFFVHYRHYWIEVLRMFTGCLLFYKGYYFIENIPEIYEMIERDLPISAFVVAHYVAGAHLAGGIMLVFGVLTRLAAAAQIPILAGAVLFVHGREAFMGSDTEFEYALLMLILLIVFFFYGSGKWSVDHRVIRKNEEDK